MSMKYRHKSIQTLEFVCFRFVGYTLCVLLAGWCLIVILDLLKMALNRTQVMSLQEGLKMPVLTST